MSIREFDEQISTAKINFTKKEDRVKKKSNKGQYKNLIKNKNKQFIALERTLEHLDKILEKTKLNKSMLEELKRDQSEILKEMNKIKNYLD